MQGRGLRDEEAERGLRAERGADPQERLMSGLSAGSRSESPSSSESSSSSAPAFAHAFRDCLRASGSVRRVDSVDSLEARSCATAQCVRRLGRGECVRRLGRGERVEPRSPGYRGSLSWLEQYSPQLPILATAQRKASCFRADRLGCVG
jgi:hypothetical protein